MADDRPGQNLMAEVEMTVISNNEGATRQDVTASAHPAASAFYGDCMHFTRLLFIILVLILSVATVIPALFYILYNVIYFKGLKGAVDNLGLLLQPIILTKKVAKGNPRWNELGCKPAYRLFLGAQPDIYGGYRSLFSKNNIRTVVSLNTAKERRGNLWMRPMSRRDWMRHQVNFVTIDLGDHSPLTQEMLGTAADEIYAGLQVGDVYVHCKAGQGRSAQAALAYFIRYEQKEVDEAIKHMKAGRPTVTLKTSDEFAILSSSKKSKEQKRHDMFTAFAVSSAREKSSYALEQTTNSATV